MPETSKIPKGRQEGTQRVVLVNGKENKPQPKTQAPPKPKHTSK
jgi:hypothetical protein